jgi:hypothetical protein
MAMAAVAIFVVPDRFVYVVYGGVLYQFEATTLQLLNSARLAQPRARARGAGRAGGGGGQGQLQPQGPPPPGTPAPAAPAPVGTWGEEDFAGTPAPAAPAPANP